jgi:hypothetical protein
MNNDVNGNRLQEFCQFKKEYRGYTECLIVVLGIANDCRLLPMISRRQSLFANRDL